MNDENMKNLAKIRFERAVELQEEAESLLIGEHYKSANNRAFYSTEKAVKAALAAKGKDAETHNGVLKPFNLEFIHNSSDFFSRDDMKSIQSIERIRNASDYDDFYVTSKAECEDQVKKSKVILDKVKVFLESERIIMDKNYGTEA